MSGDYIDIFHCPQGQSTPFCAFVWHNGAVIDTLCRPRLAPLAEWCQHQGLPVYTPSTQLRAELQQYGIDALLSHTTHTAFTPRQTQQVQIRMLGTFADLERVSRVLGALQLDGITISLHPPRPARQSDGSEALTTGAIVIAPEPQSMV